MTETGGTYEAVTPPVRRERTWLQVLRVFVIVGILVGSLQAVSGPGEHHWSDLLLDIQEGRARSVTLQRPPTDAPDGEWSSHGGRRLMVWTVDGRIPFTTMTRWAFYEYTQVNDAMPDPDGPPAYDDGQMIADEARRAGVDVVLVDVLPVPRQTFGLPLTGLAWIGALVLIVFGPQPRLATRWAWFWLGLPTASPAWAVYAAIEPVLLGRGYPVARPVRPLTGGYAFVLMLVLSVLLSVLTRVASSVWPW